jgi:hypothetical protein
MNLRAVYLLALAALSATAQPIFNIQTSPSPNGHGNTLNAVATISRTDVWAVGFQNENQLNGSRTLTEHWDGQKWTVIPSPNPGSPPSCANSNSGNMLNAVAGVASNDVWAVGFKFTCTAVVLSPLIIHWDGNKWSTVNSPPLLTNDNSALNGIIALSASNIFAVGYQPAANGAVRTLVEHWDGTKWSVVGTPNGNKTGSPLSAISAISPNDIWVVGNRVAPNTAIRTLTMHFNGTSWTVVPSPNPHTNSVLDQNVLLSVKAIAPDDVTAVGFTLDFINQRRLVLVEHWDGTKWSVVKAPDASPTFNSLTGVSGNGSKDLYAVGFFGDSSGQHELLIEHFDGSAWTIVPTPLRGLAQHLNGVSTLPGTTDVWTVGADSNFGIDPESDLLQVPQTLVLFTPAG